MTDTNSPQRTVLVLCRDDHVARFLIDRSPIHIFDAPLSAEMRHALSQWSTIMAPSGQTPSEKERRALSSAIMRLTPRVASEGAGFWAYAYVPSVRRPTPANRPWQSHVIPLVVGESLVVDGVTFFVETNSDTPDAVVSSRLDDDEERAFRRLGYEVTRSQNVPQTNLERDLAMSRPGIRVTVSFPDAKIFVADHHLDMKPGGGFEFWVGQPSSTKLSHDVLHTASSDHPKRLLHLEWRDAGPFLCELNSIEADAHVDAAERSSSSRTAVALPQGWKKEVTVKDGFFPGGSLALKVEITSNYDRASGSFAEELRCFGLSMRSTRVVASRGRAPPRGTRMCRVDDGGDSDGNTALVSRRPLLDTEIVRILTSDLGLLVGAPPPLAEPSIGAVTRDEAVIALHRIGARLPTRRELEAAQHPARRDLAEWVLDDRVPIGDGAQALLRAACRDAYTLNTDDTTHTGRVRFVDHRLNGDRPVTYRAPSYEPGSLRSGVSKMISHPDAPPTFLVKGSTGTALQSLSGENIAVVPDSLVQGEFIGVERGCVVVLVHRLLVMLDGGRWRRTPWAHTPMAIWGNSDSLFLQGPFVLEHIQNDVATTISYQVPHLAEGKILPGAGLGGTCFIPYVHREGSHIAVGAAVGLSSKISIGGGKYSLLPRIQGPWATPHGVFAVVNEAPMTLLARSDDETPHVINVGARNETQFEVSITKVRSPMLGTLVVQKPAGEIRGVTVWDKVLIVHVDDRILTADLSEAIAIFNDADAPAKPAT